MGLRGRSELCEGRLFASSNAVLAPAQAAWWSVQRAGALVGARGADGHGVGVGRTSGCGNHQEVGLKGFEHRIHMMVLLVWLTEGTT